MSTRGRTIATLASMSIACLLFGAQPAEAQWYKPWNWLSRSPEPPKPVQPGPATPSQAATGGSVAAPSEQPVQSFGQGSSAPNGQTPPPLTAQQLEERRMLITRARQRDTACDSTAACARERAELWKMVQIEDQTSVEAKLNYDKANRDLDAARARDERQLAKDETQNQDRLNRLREAEQYMRRADFDAAETLVDDVLRVAPENERARSMRSVIELRREQRGTLIRIVIVAVVCAIVLALLVWITIVAVRRHRAAKDQDVAVGDARRATLQVVDGVGRGRSASLVGDVFRIGATEGDEGTRNDLVLSDADARISRFHCNVTRRDGRFFLIDTSSNGTTLNSRTVRRGEPKRLNSGDTLVLAESAMLTFTVH